MTRHLNFCLFLAWLVIQRYSPKLSYIIPGCICMKLYKTDLSTLVLTSLVILLLSPLFDIFILLPTPWDDLTCWLKHKGNKKECVIKKWISGIFGDWSVGWYMWLISGVIHLIDQWGNLCDWSVGCFMWLISGVVHAIDQWGGSCDWSVGVIPVINQWSDLSDWSVGWFMWLISVVSGEQWNSKE